MSCLNPIFIKNKHYEAQKLFNPKKAFLYIRVPCGKCEGCLSRKRQQWFFRLNSELSSATSAYFVTLTYDDEHVPDRVSKNHVQNFLKRFRKRISPYKIRFFLVSEYGETFGRPHYHMLLFNYPFERHNLVQDLQQTWRYCIPEMFEMDGTIGNVTPASINYCAKYCLSTLATNDPNKKTFMLCSKGIGRSFITPAMSDYLRSKLNGIAMVNGYRVSLPRYLSDKIFDDREKVIINHKKQKYHEQDMDKRIDDYENRTGFNPFALLVQEQEQLRQRIQRTIKHN